MQRPSGSNRPVAKRRHSSRSRSWSMPRTIHTSPFQVDTAALPSAKKSNAAVRMREWNGFSNGIVIVSTANGPSSLPSAPLVTIGSPQRRSGGVSFRAGAPSRRIACFRAEAEADCSTAANSASVPLATRIRRRRTSWCAGTVSRMRAPRPASSGPSAPRNPAASRCGGCPSAPGHCRSQPVPSTAVAPSGPSATTRICSLPLGPSSSARTRARASGSSSNDSRTSMSPIR